MRSLMNMANKAAKARSTVLIIGETGTGKELVAQHIHQASQRTHKPLISVNCAAIPETLIESELFGYEKGAFTGANAQRLGLIEAADGGTLFLDEIGELPASAQARLLRFIQEGEIRRIGSVESASVDVRLICATHRNLMELENTDVFRRDLFHRINVLRLELPPLRERGDDIEGLTKFLIKRVSTKLQLDAKPLSPDAKKALSSYPWPGNVRELEHTIERALVLADGEVLEPHDLNLPDKPAKPKGIAKPFASASAVIEPESTASSDTDSGELSLEDYFQRFVLENQDAMNETEIAQKLGISRKCLWERRQRFDLPRTRKKGGA
jgi:transcriptional regulator with PAS, ATPase and Fis domain